MTEGPWTRRPGRAAALACFLLALTGPLTGPAAAGPCPPCAAAPPGVCGSAPDPCSGEPARVVAGPQPGVTGAVLRQFPAPQPGNGRGIAIDEAAGLVYYNLASFDEVQVSDLAGNHVRTLRPAPFALKGGPLAWDPDGGRLLALVYERDSFFVYAIDPASGADVFLCDMRVNAPHPAVAPGPENLGYFPDGLDFDRRRQTLWVSGEGSSTSQNWIAEVTIDRCLLLTAFLVRRPYGGSSGVATDGASLWHAHLGGWMVQTRPDGSPTGIEFPQVTNAEDLDHDAVTFAPRCALWANAAIFGTNLITAYEVPCPCPSPGPLPGSLGNTLRAVRSVTDVVVSWLENPAAASYELDREQVKGVWGLALRTGIATSPLTLRAEVPPPPSLFFYRMRGVTCGLSVAGD